MIPMSAIMTAMIMSATLRSLHKTVATGIVVGGGSVLGDVSTVG